MSVVIGRDEYTYIGEIHKALLSERQLKADGSNSKTTLLLYKVKVRALMGFGAETE
jgi:hypothetical protein